MIKKPLKLNKKSILITGIIILLLVAIALTLVFTINKDEDIIKTTFDINSIEITLDGEEAQAITKDFTAEPFTLSVSLNENNIDFEKYLEPTINWQIIGNSLNCTIDENGKFTIGDTLGTVTVQVKATSKNEKTATIEINIIALNTMYLESIEAVLPQGGYNLIEGQVFTPVNLKVIAHFFNQKDVYILDYSFDSDPITLVNTNANITYSHAGITRNTTIPIVVTPKTLQNIEIKKAPDKVIYIEGEVFDDSGLGIASNYEYIFNVDVTNFSVLNIGNILTPDITHITIIYTENGVTKNVLQPITVNARVLQNISLDISNVKTVYTQGEMFDTSNLIVTAHYEFFERVVIDYEIDKDSWLKGNDEVVTISYTENGLTKELGIEIDVLLPYSAIREVSFENPYDALLTWTYIYYTSDGTPKNDFTELNPEDYEGAALGYDAQTGVYRIPVGASLTLSVINPTVIDFKFGEDDETPRLIYPETTYSFVLEDGEGPLEIYFKKVAGDKLTVRFEDGFDGTSWAFVYPLNWNAPLRAMDLAKIKQIYEENETSYYKFITGGIEYSFEELATLDINSNILFTITKHDRVQSNVITINVEYYNDIVLSVVVDKTNEFALSGLPELKRAGYLLEGFYETLASLTAFDEQGFNTWLLTANNDDTIYAKYVLNANAQTGDVIGTWYYSETIDVGEITLTATFNADGTFNYIVEVDGTINCAVNGIYEIIEDEVFILSIETNMLYQLIAPSDFVISYNLGSLNITLFMLDDLTVFSKQVIIT